MKTIKKSHRNAIPQAQTKCFYSYIVAENGGKVKHEI